MKSKFKRGDRVSLCACTFYDKTGEYAGSYTVYGTVTGIEFFEDDEPWIEVKSDLTGRKVMEIESMVYRIGD